MKVAFYENLAPQLQSLMDPDLPTVTNLANAAALIYWALRDEPSSRPVNWVGFYLTDAQGKELLLGPFQGRVACVKIPFNKGVVGSSATARKTIVVPNVHDFPGHIACDSASESEIVVPIFYGEDEKLVGVLDIDCLEKNGFDEEDRVGLEQLVKIISAACSWK
ncbi:hypothetical protein HK102_000714 [Quaeritorhiza haematococci]|nr:hypothetical protein HK102_000714 [Quaeritorhiza haematococci]